jgi:small subunit ribosomal protein S19e
MTTAFEVPPDKLIAVLAEKLKAEGKIKPPEWAAYARTGVHTERAPTNPDWWFVRCASLLRRIYIDGPVGISRLRTCYGGRERRGVASARFAKGSGNIIRKALQQLQKAGYINITRKGRSISPRGRSFLDNLAKEIISKAKDEKVVSDDSPTANPAVPVSKSDQPKSPVSTKQTGDTQKTPGG